MEKQTGGTTNTFARYGTSVICDRLKRHLAQRLIALSPSPSGPFPPEVVLQPDEEREEEEDRNSPTHAEESLAR